MIRLFFLITLLTPTYLFSQNSDDISLKLTKTGPGVTGIFVPMKQPTALVLEAEAMRIFLREDKAEIEAEYIVHNPSDSLVIKEELGFPILSSQQEPFKLPTLQSFLDKSTLSVTIQIQSTTVTNDYKRYMPYIETFDLKNHWHIVEAEFQPNQKSTFRFEYELPYLSKMEEYRGRVEQSPRLIRYLRGYGDRWTKKIIQAVVYVIPKMTQPHNLKRYAAPTKIEFDRFTYRFDLKRPHRSMNLSFVYDPVYLKMRPDGFQKNRQIRTKETMNDDYTLKNLVDGDPDTSWCEGEVGTGEKYGFEIEWGKEWPISALHVYSGHAGEKEDFSKRNRLKEIRFYVGKLGWTSEILGPFTLKDQPKMQRLPIEIEEPVSFLGLQIRDVYPGSDFNDTCLTEVQVERTH